MPKINAIRTVLLLLIVATFALGVVRLFLLRFAAGDVYPAYSSLRSDPLGSRAFYNSLENINSSRVSRNFLTLQNLEFKQQTAFFYIGAAAFDSGSVSLEWLRKFEGLTDRGGRLVFSFFAVEKKPPDRRMQKCSEPCVALKDQWGLTFAFAEKPSDKAVRVGDDSTSAHIKNLPTAISWHTALYFDELEAVWRVIYTADGRPAIIERSFGNGSLVFSADSFFLSNEALRSERHPHLLTWLLGDSTDIVFDEAHFGILRHPGVLDLIKRHRFHWFILTIGILAILFIWKNSISLVPPPKRSRSQAAENVASDRDSTQGLVSLLRRNIPPGRLLQTCSGEWQRSVQPEKWFRGERLMQIKSVLQKIETQSPRSIDPVAGYRRISKIISKGKRYE